MTLYRCSTIKLLGFILHNKKCKRMKRKLLMTVHCSFFYHFFLNSSSTFICPSVLNPVGVWIFQASCSQRITLMIEFIAMNLDDNYNDKYNYHNVNAHNHNTKSFLVALHFRWQRWTIKIDQFPTDTCGFIAQLVEHCSSVAEVTSLGRCSIFQVRCHLVRAHQHCTARHWKGHKVLSSVPFIPKADLLMQVSLNLSHHTSNVGSLATMLA